jgi:hypothetical protein
MKRRRFSTSISSIYEFVVPDGWGGGGSVDFLKPSSNGWFPTSKEMTDKCEFTSLLNLFTGKTVNLEPPCHRPNWYTNSSSRSNLMQIFLDNHFGKLVTAP